MMILLYIAVCHRVVLHKITTTSQCSCYRCTTATRAPPVTTVVSFAPYTPAVHPHPKRTALTPTPTPRDDAELLFDAQAHTHAHTLACTLIDLVTDCDTNRARRTFALQTFYTNNMIMCVYKT